MQLAAPQWNILILKLISSSEDNRYAIKFISSGESTDVIPRLNYHVNLLPWLVLISNAVKNEFALCGLSPQMSFFF